MEITPFNAQQSRSLNLLSGQRHVLQLINEDRPLYETLSAICLLIESQVEETLCSVMLLDKTGEHLLHGAAPSLPEDYCAAIDGMSTGPTVGSCGTAAYTAQPCLVEDIAIHPNWVAFRQLAYVKHGLRACWSVPIRSYDGKVLATFAMYYRTPRLPTLQERKLVDLNSHLVAIAVNRSRERELLATITEQVLPHNPFS